MKQTTIAGLAFDANTKRTRREQFMAEMEAVIPWARLFGLVAPPLTGGGSGRRPLGLERMLRIYLMQHRH
jgi:transposase, IS5 family